MTDLVEASDEQSIVSLRAWCPHSWSVLPPRILVTWIQCNTWYILSSGRQQTLEQTDSHTARTHARTGTVHDKYNSWLILKISIATKRRLLLTCQVKKKRIRNLSEQVVTVKSEMKRGTETKCIKVEADFTEGILTPDWDCSLPGTEAELGTSMNCWFSAKIPDSGVLIAACCNLLFCLSSGLLL